MYQTEKKDYVDLPSGSTLLADYRTVIYETKDNSMKYIQNVALYVLAVNCGIIAYWFAQYKPIYKDFRTNHGAKKDNGERNGRPRTKSILGCELKCLSVGLTRFIIAVEFITKVLFPFVDSITGN